LPQEVLDGFKKVEDIDSFEFVDGIDPESCAYMYFNQLNQFRYEFAVSNPFSFNTDFLFSSRPNSKYMGS
jgi:flagellar assembly factor FliW